MRPTISLLHATYHRPGGPLEVEERWLAAAERPDLVEYVVAMDDDDEVALRLTRDRDRVVSPATPDRVTAVRNWNAAAAAASGDLLMVVADDLFPPPAWDTALVGIIDRLDPRRTRFVVKVGDSPLADDVLLRHPVASRAFYRRFGLFSSAFDGVFSDNELTTRAFWKSVVIDGRALVLEHRHPKLDASVPASVSQRRMNVPEEYARAAAAYEAGWTSHERSTAVRLVPVQAGVSLRASTVRRFRLRHPMRERARHALRRAKGRARRLARFG